VTRYVAVIGPSDATEEQISIARAVGAGLAREGAIVVTGGRGGVMAAASRGAAEAGGAAVGILPGTSREEANEWVTVAIPTGLGELRNGLVVRSADAVVAVGGAYGTLAEIALALERGIPVIGLETWQIDGVQRVSAPEEAVARAT
jgi:uncharacterized protein (TIGR00725 family)